MCANWTSHGALHWAFAPTSSTTAPPVGFGKNAASAGRDTPSRRPSPSSAAATTAPVFPALNTASSRPSLWSWIMTPSDEFVFRRTAAAAFSAMSMRSGACTTSTGRRSAPARWSAGRISASSPISVMVKRPGISRNAMTMPSAITPGPWSPPIASIPMRGIELIEPVALGAYSVDGRRISSPS
jgi:hypothetical protein